MAYFRTSVGVKIAIPAQPTLSALHTYAADSAILDAKYFPTIDHNISLTRQQSYYQPPTDSIAILPAYPAIYASP